MAKSQYNVIDLFCGCGGMSLGFEQAGFDVLLGIDMWKDALVTFSKNHKIGNTLCADLANLQAEEVETEIGNKKVDVIIGGPPCQGFSIAGKRIVEDERNSLYKSFVRMVAHFKPKAFVLENVPNILSIGDGIVRDAIIGDFTQLGYTVVTKVLTASDYGVPQNRKRAIFVGMLNGERYSFPKEFDTPKVTCAEALSDLPEGKEAMHNLLNNTSITKNEEGKFGESLIYGHEKMRLKMANYDLKEFVVKIVDNPSTRPGYDIESYEADGTDDIRYIEVKTTVSKSPVRMYSFHMTKHEWRVAKTVKEHYCVYRLMINHKDLVLYILRNPLYLSQNELIDFEPNDDGLDFSFDFNNFKTTDILLWQD